MLGNPASLLNTRMLTPVYQLGHATNASRRLAAYPDSVYRQIGAERGQRSRQQELEEDERVKREYYNSEKNTIVWVNALCELRALGSVEWHYIYLFRRADGSALYLRYGREGRILSEEAAPITEESKERLNQTYHAWKRFLSPSSVVIPVAKWALYEEMLRLVQSFQNPYEWDGLLHRWVRV
jgi:hypothetical protein